MGKSYAEKLKDQRWQKKRLALLEAANWRCREFMCQNDIENPTLHVHHRVYLRNRDPWDYPDWAYVVLCEKCHEIEQERMEAAHCAIAQNPNLLFFLCDVSRLSEATRSSVIASVCGLFVQRNDEQSNLASELLKNVRDLLDARRNG